MLFGCLWRVAQDGKHLQSVAGAEFTISGGSEVEVVRAAGAAVRSNVIGRGGRPRQVGDDLVHARARPLLILWHQAAGEQRHFLGLEVEILEQAVVDIFHFVGPLLVIGIGFALVQQDAFDDPIVLGQLRHRDEMLVRIATVDADDVGHPPGRCRRIMLKRILLEQLDFAASNRNVHDANLDARRQVGNQCAAEIIRWAESCRGPAERRSGGIPVALRSLLLWKIYGGENFEAIVHPGLVLFFYARKSLHIGLAETQKDPEVRVLAKGAQVAEQ